MADEQVTELPAAPKGADDSTTVAKEFQTHEFQRVNQNKEPIEKLAEAMEAKPELSEPEDSQTELPPAESVEKKEELPPKKEAFDHEKWDGKVESLPEKLQKVVKDNQAAYTAKSQEAAQLKQQLELISKKPDASSPLFTQEEYEAALISPDKFVEVVNKLIMKGVEQKSAELLPTITKIQHTQIVAENEKAINDFAKEHEDFWDLHDASPKLFMSLIGQTKNLQETYETLKQFKSAQADKAKQDAQVRVKEKKAASTFGRTAKHTENIMYVEGSDDDVLAKQVEMTMMGKNIQVRKKK